MIKFSSWSQFSFFIFKVVLKSPLWKRKYETQNRKTRSKSGSFAFMSNPVRVEKSEVESSKGESITLSNFIETIQKRA